MLEVSCHADSEAPSGLLVALAGDLDAMGVPELWGAVSAHLESGSACLLLDLSRVEHLNSAGVGMLIKIRNLADSRGGAAAVFGCNARVRQVLHIGMLEEILGVVESAREARELLRQRRRG